MTTQERYDFGFEKGNDAFHAGNARSANPYIEQLPTAEASGWADGWDWGKSHAEVAV